MINLSKIKKAYFIGLKGVGMTALAQVLQSRGIEILGSDTQEKFFTDEVLEKLGIRVIEGFNKKNIPNDLDLVIASAAYLGEEGIENVEVAEVKKRGIPILTYAQVLGMFFREKQGIAVAGTHGKSTITAMLGVVLEAAGLDPTVIVGTKVLQWQSNARVGASPYLIAEADEYRNNFLHYSPQALVLSSLEYDHPDFFKDFEEYKETFRRLIRKIPQDGFIVANGQDEEVRKAVKEARCPIIEYGFSLLDLKLGIPGQYNLLNASAVLSVALKLGVDREVIKRALANFKGTSRRFELKGERAGIIFIDDYAHHPTEVRAVLKAVKNLYPQREVWAVFQPHTFSRTKALFKDFSQSFSQADKVIILDIYGSAREKAGIIHAQDLAREISKFENKTSQRGFSSKDKVKYIPTIEKARDYLKKQAKSGQVILTMGAGDVWKLSESLIQ